jgi:hypothetical protein
VAVAVEVEEHLTLLEVPAETVVLVLLLFATHLATQSVVVLD